MRVAIRFCVLAGLWAGLATAQDANPASPSAAVDQTASCCGSVTDAGHQLIAVLDHMDVEHRWLADRHVHWESGRPEGGIILDGKAHTHCSAFAAAAGERLGIYMLRPPEHGQQFLASAQGLWFTTEKAAKSGWVELRTAREAQERANRGELVVLDYPSPVSGEHGHVVLVRPMAKSESALATEGPETMQAGTTNFADGNAARSFHSHPGAWPSRVLMYAHATKFSAAAAHQSFLEDKTPGEEEPTP